MAAEAEVIREALHTGLRWEQSQAARNALDSLLARLREAENKFEIMCEENADNLASLETAERERDHWKQEAAGLASEQRVAEATEAENKRLREALETICEIGETRDVEVALAALARTEEPV